MQYESAKKREAEQHLQDAAEVFDEVENDMVMQNLWQDYRKNFSYSSKILWAYFMKSVRELYQRTE